MNSGIYVIINIINGKKYVGSAVDLTKRWYKHIWELNNQKHINKHLQNAWNKYGEKNFNFEILEYAAPENLVQIEQHYLDWMETSKSENGYNLAPVAGSIMGYKFTDKSKEKMSKSHLGSKNHFFGRQHSEKVLNKFRKMFAGERSAKAKLSWTDVKEIREKYAPHHYTAKMLSEEYGVSLGAIKKVIYKERWDENYRES